MILRQNTSKKKCTDILLVLLGLLELGHGLWLDTFSHICIFIAAVLTHCSISEGDHQHRVIVRGGHRGRRHGDTTIITEQREGRNIHDEIKIPTEQN